MAVFNNKYIVYRRDRESSGFHGNKGGGGILVAVSRNIHSVRLSNYESKCEDLWLKLLINKTKIILLGAVYLPPPIQPQILQHFVDNANNALESYDNILLCGDFNMCDLIWSGQSGLPLNVKANTHNSTYKCFMDFINLNGLKQYNNVKNHLGRSLDLIFSTETVSDLHEPDFSISNKDCHHPPLNFSISCAYRQHKEFLTVKENASKLNFYRGDYIKICDYLGDTHWNEKFESCKSVDDMVEVFYAILNYAIKKYVPLIKLKSSK
jgi:hypothetical protein